MNKEQKQALKSLNAGLDIVELEKKELNVKEFRDGLDVEKVKSYYPWLLDASIKDDVVIGQAGNYKLIWYEGTWENGFWEDGIWKDGTWENGIWADGEWKKGAWCNGIWTKGIWKKGTWFHGIWQDGTWKSGTWKNGTWEFGTWKGGTWEDGVWLAGNWAGGGWQIERNAHENRDFLCLAKFQTGIIDRYGTKKHGDGKYEKRFLAINTEGDRKSELIDETNLSIGQLLP